MTVFGKTCRLSVMLAMTCGYFLVEIVFGYLTNSMALVADSFHMLSDVLALCIAFYCMRVSKQRSRKNTFGWVRAEILGALVNAVFLLALCFSILVEALKRMIAPEEINNPLKILVVGSLGFVVNLIGIVMFHSHSHLHVAAKIDDETSDEEQERQELFSSYQVLATEAHNVSVLMNMPDEDDKSQSRQSGLSTTDQSEMLTNVGKKMVIVDDKLAVTSSRNAAQMNMHGVFLHILGDAFGSLIVIITALVCWQVDNQHLRYYLDPGLSLAMVCIIVSSTLPLLKESALILLQTPPKFMDVPKMKAKLLEIKGVLAIHEFHVWRLAGQKVIATAHIRFANLHDYLKAAEKIKNFFHDQHIHSTTIQPEFEQMNSLLETECSLSCPPEQCDLSVTCCGPVKSSRISDGIVNDS